MEKPWVDLSCSTRSWEENKDLDWLPFQASDIHAALGPNLAHPVYSYCFGDIDSPSTVISPLYVHESIFSFSEYHQRSKKSIDEIMTDENKRDIIERFVRHPLVSPVFADNFSGLPPILIVNLLIYNYILTLIIAIRRV